MAGIILGPVRNKAVVQPVFRCSVPGHEQRLEHSLLHAAKEQGTLRCFVELPDIKTWSVWTWNSSTRFRRNRSKSSLLAIGTCQWKAPCDSGWKKRSRYSGDRFERGMELGPWFASALHMNEYEWRMQYACGKHVDLSMHMDVRLWQQLRSTTTFVAKCLYKMPTLLEDRRFAWRGDFHGWWVASKRATWPWVPQQFSEKDKGWDAWIILRYRYQGQQEANGWGMCLSTTIYNNCFVVLFPESYQAYKSSEKVDIVNIDLPWRVIQKLLHLREVDQSKGIFGYEWRSTIWERRVILLKHWNDMKWWNDVRDQWLSDGVVWQLCTSSSPQWEHDWDDCVLGGRCHAYRAMRKCRKNDVLFLQIFVLWVACDVVPMCSNQSWQPNCHKEPWN